MNLSILIIFLSAILSGYIVSVFLPKILFISLKKNLLDPIDDRKVHQTTASRLGGVSFYPAIFISFAMCSILADFFCILNFEITSIAILELALLFILYFVGMYDDIVGVNFKVKFLAQIVVALFVILTGTYLKSFYGIDGAILIPLWIAIPLSLLLIVFIVNAINLIDGINGLASMLSMVALSTYGVIFMLTDDLIYSMISFAAVGALVPFWHHNVFGVRQRTQSRIFMGDCGALVIGAILSIMAIRVWNTPSEEYSMVTPEMCHILAYTVLFVPCLDVVRVVLYRLKTRNPLFLPDNNHIHHKFMALGNTPRQALWIISAIQIFYLLLNILLATMFNILYIFAIDVIIWMIMHTILTNRIKNNNRL